MRLSTKRHRPILGDDARYPVKIADIASDELELVAGSGDAYHAVGAADAADRGRKCEEAGEVFIGEWKDLNPFEMIEDVRKELVSRRAPPALLLATDYREGSVDGLFRRDNADEDMLRRECGDAARERSWLTAFAKVQGERVGIEEIHLSAKLFAFIFNALALAVLPDGVYQFVPCRVVRMNTGQRGERVIWDWRKITVN